MAIRIGCASCSRMQGRKQNEKEETIMTRYLPVFAAQAIYCLTIVIVCALLTFF